MKTEPSILKKIHLIVKDRHDLRVKAWKDIFQGNGPKKQTSIATSISDNIDFKPKLVIRGNSEGIVVLNIYVPNKDRRAPRASPELCSAVVSSYYRENSWAK